uniref:TonB-dependent receptor n=1 Tax=candidate division WOR-3 bacterium TaxID=2052148 RepID=A0A7V0Z4P3_UNCW3
MKKLIFFITAIFIFNHPISARERNNNSTGRITGIVVESVTEQPIERVNIIIYDKTHKQLTGAATNETGRFFITGINPGEYIIEFSFVGFETKTDTIHITPDNPILNLGVIKLEQKPITIEGVEVTAEKPPIEFKIDKKVINVKEHYASQSGSAVDVLENVPAITVDIQGNVSLRGSTNFRVLIDNRPSILEPSDALQQIPASTIDRIEIITNPSARNDPEGLAGIINVITKKNIQSGINGIANLNLGLEQKYSGDFLLNYRYKKFRTFFGLDYNNFNFPGTEIENRTTNTQDTTFYSLTQGNSSWLRRFYGFKLGTEYVITPKAKAGINFELRNRNMERSSFQELIKWSIPGDTTDFVRDNQTERGGLMYAINTDYLVNFKKEQKLSARLSVNINNVEDRSTNELSTQDSLINDGWRSIEKGPMKRVLFNLDYTQPFTLFNEKNGKLETGTQTTIKLSNGGQDVYVYDTVTKEYTYKPEFSHLADFIHNIYAFYTTYRGEIKNFGYQTGIRAEYTYRFLELTGTAQNVNIKRFDIFPSLHLSYKFPPFDQIMISWTRRVNRPRDWDLQPFEIRRDPYSIHKGNPGLLPEFVNAFELGYQRQWNNLLFSLDGYFRLTENHIEYITHLYGGDTLLSTVENIGKDYAYGIEPTLDLKILKWLNINLSGNIYEHRIEGKIDNSSFTQKSQTWSLRNMNSIILTKAARLQITIMYNGPEIMAQGERKSFFIVNGGIRQEIIPRSLNLTLQVRDIFGTGKFENTSEGTNFYIHQAHKRKSPTIMLGLSYNFNNYRAEPKKYESEENFEDMENNF